MIQTLGAERNSEASLLDAAKKMAAVLVNLKDNDFFLKEWRVPDRGIRISVTSWLLCLLRRLLSRRGSFQKLLQ